MARFGSRFPAVMAGIPFFAALVGHFVAVRPVPMADAAPRPPLAFNQYTLDLRTVPPRPLVREHFDFTNVGTGPLSITELEPSCACLNPQLRGDKRVYAPGERGRFYVFMQTAREQPGPHSYTVTVKYADPQPREVVVEFRLTLPEMKVTLDPPEVYFYQLSGADDERTIHVSDRRGRQLKVLAADCSLEGVRVEVQSPEMSPDGEERTPLKVFVPGEYAPGRHKGYINIVTDDPEFKELRAAILVEGPSVRQVGLETESADDHQ